MKKRTLKLSVIFTLITFCFLFKSIELAIAKDPDYPTRPINFIIPYGSGGIIDTISRSFIDIASKYVGQPIAPINRPGGAGTVAAMVVATAKPDGYTLGACTASQCLIAPFDPETPYKNLDGFTFIMNFGGNLHAYIIRNDAPWKTWREFVDAAKKRPGEVKIGLAGAQHNNYSGLTLSQVAEKEKVKFAFIPFKSGAEIITALMGGHIDLYATAVDPTTMSFVKQGKARLVATADTKIPGFEEIPTLMELYDLSREINPHLVGLFGPKGLPDPIVEKLEDAFSKAAKDPDFIKIVNQLYVPYRYMNRSEMNQFIDKAFRATGEAIKKVREQLATEKK